MRFLITGGAGFIGSAVVRKLLTEHEHEVVVIDKLTYAGSMSTLAPFVDAQRFVFEQADIADAPAVKRIFNDHAPDIVLHLAAESHVDRSIDAPSDFIQTNIVGTYVLLQEALTYFNSLSQYRKKIFRFHHVSTDEVFGSLGDAGYFTECTPYAPTSPYSSSKAASDHLVRAWGHTYHLPISISNCSNNYGPYQFPEKLIPLTILNAIEGKSLPVYGNGLNVRDWLHVDDHAEALLVVALKGRVHQTYNVGGNAERRNIDVVEGICSILDEVVPNSSGTYARLITHVADRPGHDLRYAIDATKMRTELLWSPSRTFEEGLRETVEWYIANPDWWGNIRASVYSGERLGMQISVAADAASV